MDSEMQQRSFLEGLRKIELLKQYILSEARLSQCEYMFLDKIATQAKFGKELNQIQVAKEILAINTSISHICKDFERRGLIALKKKSDSKKSQYIVLTDQGRELYESVKRAVEKKLSPLIEKFGDQGFENMVCLMSNFYETANVPFYPVI